MYKILTKWLLTVLWFGMGTSCISDQKPNSDFTDVQSSLVRAFYSEQGSPLPGGYLITLDKNGNPYIDMINWGNPNLESYYLLVNDTAVHVAVLTETLNKLRVSDRRFRGIRYANNTVLRIDSIKIVTDSAIVLNKLSFWRCSLTHLPESIGKIRVKHFDITGNGKSFTISEAIKGMAEQPVYWDSLIIDYAKNYINAMPTISDSLKTWLWDHCKINEDATFSVGK